MVSINDLAKMVMEIADKGMSINHIPGPVGVRGRNSDNTLIKEKLDWSRPSRYEKVSRRPINGLRRRCKKNTRSDSKLLTPPPYGKLRGYRVYLVAVPPVCWRRFSEQLRAKDWRCCADS